MDGARQVNKCLKDATGWSVYECPNGNVEVIIYVHHAAIRFEALEWAMAQFPDMPVFDTWLTDDGVEVVVFGEDPEEWR